MESELEYPRLRSIEAFPTVHQGRELLCLRDPTGYTDGAVFVPHQLAAILRLCDGRHSLLDIQASISREFGELLFREQLLGILRPLDEALLLESPRFAAHASAIREEFRRTSRRPARLAGRSYAEEPTDLRQELDGYFGTEDGPGDRPASAEAGRLTGLVVPHIDFARGGPCYAWGYRELAGAGPVDRWIVLGTVHAPIARPFALTRKDFETPLGLVETDRAVVEGLLRRVGADYLEDEFAHRGEHSIEFQAVWLRHVLPTDAPVRILPILCGSFQRWVEDGGGPGGDAELGRFLEALGESAAEAGGRTVVIASADLAHVGPQFGDELPVSQGRLREVEAADLAMLRSVEAGDPEAFFQSVARDRDRRNICGLPPIYALLRLVGQGQGRLLRYGQWPDPDGTVTFAALAMYAGEEPSV
jgi:MEMO1 family protein